MEVLKVMSFSKNLAIEENKDQNILKKNLKKHEQKKQLIFKQISTISNINKNFKIYIPKKYMV